MSIILDALKKSQRIIKKEGVAEEVKEAKVSVDTHLEERAPSKVRTFPGWNKATALLLILFIALACYVAGGSLIKRSAKDEVKGPLKSEPEDTPSRQEIIYKPKPQSPQESSDVRFHWPSEAAKLPQETKPEYPKFILSGIMYLKDAPQAIINGSVVREGDIINGAKVLRINRNDVVLNFENVEILLNLK